MSISEAINAFLAHCHFEKNLSEKTIISYQLDLKQFAEFLKTENYPDQITEITKDIMKSYLQELSHFKPKTIKRKIASLKAMFNFLEFEEHILINPFRKIKIRIKEAFVLPTVMTSNEIGAILKKAFDEKHSYPNKTSYAYKELIRNIAVLELLFASGVRVSELCNLKVENLNLSAGYLKVTGKGNKERLIHICEKETLQALREYFFYFSNLIPDKGSFFINRLGNQLSDQSVRLMIKKYKNLAGISKNITPHTFRHTFATLLLEEDVDIKYIQNILGHSSIMTTQIYTHVNSEKQRLILSTKHPRRHIKF